MNPRELPEPLSLADMAAAARAEGTGIKCPRCGCLQFRDGQNVRNTRRVKGGVRRYRTCRACGHGWTTMEQ